MKFGMKPLPELVGQIAMSSNKTNAENNKTDEQKNNEGGGKKDEQGVN